MKPYRTLCLELKTNYLLKFHFINFAKLLHSKKEFFIRDMNPKEETAQTPA